MKIKTFMLTAMASAMIAIPLLGSEAIVSSAAAYDACAVCDRLWYQRNAIYARMGYCFKTRRARAVFGRRCYPPYGRLNWRQRRRVNRIRRRERLLQCDRYCR